MRQLLITVALTFVCHGLFAQKGQVSKATTYKESGELDKALECIQAAIDPENEKSEKSVAWPRTWQVRGEIFQEIHKSTDKKHSALSSDPLTDAFNSYKKALELDEKDRYEKSLKVNLILLVEDLQNDAIEAYNNNSYDVALQRFEQVHEVNSMPVVTDGENLIDTAIIYNMGMAAFNAKEYDKAIEYLNEAARYGYNRGTTYVWISNAYEQKEDTVKALDILMNGFQEYPNDKDLMNGMIQTFINLRRKKEAVKYLDMAIEKNPSDVNYYLAKGDLLKDNADGDNAILCYQKALDIEPANFIALYNLGVIYFNRGVNQLKVLDTIPVNDNVAYEREMKKSEVWWKKSLPFMEKCHEIKPSDATVKESLGTLYYRLKMMDEYKAISERN